jgi:hypothetical protein
MLEPPHVLHSKHMCSIKGGRAKFSPKPKKGNERIWRIHGNLVCSSVAFFWFIDRSPKKLTITAMMMLN